MFRFIVQLLVIVVIYKFDVLALRNVNSMLSSKYEGLWQGEVEPIKLVDTGAGNLLHQNDGPVANLVSGLFKRTRMIKAVIQNHHRYTGSSTSFAVKAQHVLFKQRCDHYGHLIGKQFGGTGKKAYNIIAQNGATNLGLWKVLVENPIRKQLDMNKTVTFTVTLLYPHFNTRRPSELLAKASTEDGWYLDERVPNENCEEKKRNKTNSDPINRSLPGLSSLVVVNEIKEPWKEGKRQDKKISNQHGDQQAAWNKDWKTRWDPEPCFYCWFGISNIFHSSLDSNVFYAIFLAVICLPIGVAVMEDLRVDSKVAASSLKPTSSIRRNGRYRCRTWGSPVMEDQRVDSKVAANSLKPTSSIPSPDPAPPILVSRNTSSVPSSSSPRPSFSPDFPALTQALLAPDFRTAATTTQTLATAILNFSFPNPAATATQTLATAILNRSSGRAGSLRIPKSDLAVSLLIGSTGSHWL